MLFLFGLFRAVYRVEPLLKRTDSLWFVPIGEAWRIWLSESDGAGYEPAAGGVAEWSNAPVLKTGVRESVPWVRIPPPPPPYFLHVFNNLS